MRNSVKRFSLFGGKLTLLQHEKHRVSTDLVVFLSKLRGVKPKSKVVDLGAGFGFLSLAVAKKFGCRVIAVERNEELFDLLLENIRSNSLESLVTPVLMDVRDIKGSMDKGAFDAVITNPPFYPRDYGKSDGGFHFEGDATLRDFLNASAHLLRDGRYLNLLIPSFRLYEAFIYMYELRLTPKFLTMIYPTPKKTAKLSVVVSVKNAPMGLETDKAVIINDPAGGFTEEVEALLEGYL